MEGNKEVFTSLRQFSRLQKVATRTREDQLFTLAVGNTGIGKTTTIQQLYYEAPSTTFYVNIDFQMTWTVLMREIAKAMGVPHYGTKTQDLIESMRRKIEQLSSKKTLLIIDEAEVLKLNSLFKTKCLYNMCQGRMGILIIGHSSLRRRLQSAAKIDDQGHTLAGKEETEYATLCRRLTHVSLPPVDPSDIENLCKKELKISNAKVIELATDAWSNYGKMAQHLQIAKASGLDMSTITETDFQHLLTH